MKYVVVWHAPPQKTGCVCLVIDTVQGKHLKTNTVHNKHSFIIITWVKSISSGFLRRKLQIEVVLLELLFFLFYHRVLNGIFCESATSYIYSKSIPYTKLHSENNVTAKSRKTEAIRNNNNHFFFSYNVLLSDHFLVSIRKLKKLNLVGHTIVRWNPK